MGFFSIYFLFLFYPWVLRIYVYVHAVFVDHEQLLRFERLFGVFKWGLFVVLLHLVICLPICVGFEFNASDSNVSKWGGCNLIGDVCNLFPSCFVLLSS